MQFRMILELTVTVVSEPQLWLLSASLCPCSQGPLQTPVLFSSEQNSNALLLLKLTSSGILTAQRCEGSGELCASMDLSYHASSQLQELLLWERRAPFSHVRLNKLFSVCQRNSVSGLNRIFQRVNSQNCGYVGCYLGEKRGFFVFCGIDTGFLNLNQIKIYEAGYNIII